jgi:hypothetical protein
MTKTIEDIPEMKLGEYLGKLKSRSNDKLMEEYGVCDKYDILLKGDTDKVLGSLLDTTNYYVVGDVIGDIGGNRKFTVKRLNGGLFSVMELRNGFFPIRKFMLEYEDLKRIEKTKYNLTFVLHPDQFTARVMKTPLIKQIASLIIDLGEFIQNENIPACFPETLGTNYQHMNMLRVIYNEPKP